MYPEAGGSSSFARRAFNEFWSFFAAWGQMLNYIITVAISAFFVPHYLAVFWEPLGESPADIVGGIVVVVILGGGERRRASRSRRASTSSSRSRTSSPRWCWWSWAWCWCSRRRCWSTTWTSARTRRSGTSWSRSRSAMVAYTGIETVSNMAEEARDYGTTIPRGIGGRGGGGGRDLRLPAGGGAVGDAGRGRRDAARAAQGGGRLRRRPDPRAWSRTSTSASLQEPGRDLRRHPGRHDPVHRHQRGHDRRVAAHLLDGPAPPAARGAAPAAPQVPHALRRDPRVRRRSPA